MTTSSFAWMRTSPAFASSSTERPAGGRPATVDEAVGLGVCHAGGRQSVLIVDNLPGRAAATGELVEIQVLDPLDDGCAVSPR